MSVTRENRRTQAKVPWESGGFCKGTVKSPRLRRDVRLWRRGT